MELRWKCVVYSADYMHQCSVSTSRMVSRQYHVNKASRRKRPSSSPISIALYSEFVGKVFPFGRQQLLSIGSK
jgi:hypothetical protein